MKDKDRAPQWGDEPAGVTKQEWLATAISALLIGCLVGWALFGSPSQARAICNSVDLADWLAAAGTWVIGAGAFWYARESHLKRIHDSYFQEQRIAEELSTRFTIVDTKVKEGGFAAHSMRLWKTEDSKMSLAMLKAYASALQTTVNSFGVPEEQLHLMSKATFKLFLELKLSMPVISANLAALIAAIDATEKKRESDDYDALEDTDYSEEIQVALDDLENACNVAEQEMKATRNSLNVDASKVRWPERPRSLK